MQHAPQQWKQHYDRDGFLVVEDCLDPTTLAALRERLDAILDDPDQVAPELRHHIETEGEYAETAIGRKHGVSGVGRQSVRRIMELPLFDPIFARLIVHEPMLDVLQALFGSTEFHFHNYKVINKAPQASSSFVWHRDLPYLYHSTPNLITGMFCLDDMTEANGATVVLPGSHRLVDENVALSDQDMDESDLPEGYERRVVECPAGSLVLFHVNIVHGGGANRSPIPRRNVIGIWAGPDTYPVGPRRYAYQDLYPRSIDPARQRQLAMSGLGVPART